MGQLMSLSKHCSKVAASFRKLLNTKPTALSDFWNRISNDQKRLCLALF